MRQQGKVPVSSSAGRARRSTAPRLRHEERKLTQRGRQEGCPGVENAVTMYQRPECKHRCQEMPQHHRS
jgi:hypothetical protein